MRQVLNVIAEEIAKSTASLREGVLLLSAVPYRENKVMISWRDQEPECAVLNPPVWKIQLCLEGLVDFGDDAVRESVTTILECGR